MSDNEDNDNYEEYESDDSYESYYDDRGMIVYIQSGDSIYEYFSDSRLFDNYEGVQSRYGRSFDEETIINLQTSLLNHPNLGTDQEYNSRNNCGADIVNHTYDNYTDEITPGDIYIEALIVDFMFTFGRPAVLGDPVCSSMFVQSLY